MGEMQDLNQVDEAAGFSHFEDGLTEQDHEIVAKIRINGNATYNNFGDMQAVESDVTKLFIQLGNSPAAAKEQASVVAKMVERIQSGFGAESSWVAIRVSTPNNDFDMPRWHTDGFFAGFNEQDQLKAIKSLQGASTLLRRADPEQREKVLQLQRADMDETESRQRREVILDGAPVETTPPGCCTVFIAGPRHGAMHSEPPVHEPRIFVSVLPGTKDQIEGLRKEWDAPKAEIISPAKSKAAQLKS